MGVWFTWEELGRLKLFPIEREYPADQELLLLLPEPVPPLVVVYGLVPHRVELLLEPRAGGLPDRVVLALGLCRVGFVEAEQLKVLCVRELHLLHCGVEGGRALLQGRPNDLKNYAYINAYLKTFESD